tara:strand:+ start:1250 stop:1762 length:513 start_codon:yes stop_codon:yes gene_type:complete
VAEEFIINSNAIETKINSLLPSQGGFAPGVDFSASTMVIPIVDLTETAQGGTTRQDLQSALSLASCTVFDVTNTTTTIVNTTGYWRVTAVSSCGGSPTVRNSIIMTDGTTTKQMWEHLMNGTGNSCLNIDYIFFLPAGVSLQVKSDSSGATIAGSVRQLADLSGNLVNPI